MGWELRNGRRYLYRYSRVNGRPRKEYLASEGEFGELMAYELNARQRNEARVRKTLAKQGKQFRRGADSVLTELTVTNQQLKTIVEGALIALGFHNHHRGEWRMARNKGLGTLWAPLQQQDKKPEPLINYIAPEHDAEAVELFAKARAGDGKAIAGVRKLLVDRRWADSMGDLGAQAATRIMAKATAGDEVWKAAILEKVQSLWAELGGATAPALEKLLMRRVVNGWLAVHVLELQQVMRPPAAVKDQDFLDRALSKAQRRYTEAIGVLARVRRLNIQLVLAQVNVTNHPAMGTTSTTAAQAACRDAEAAQNPQNA